MLDNVIVCVYVCAHIACVCVYIFELFAAYGKFLRVFYFIQARDTLSAENADLCEHLRGKNQDTRPPATS